MQFGIQHGDMAPVDWNVEVGKKEIRFRKTFLQKERFKITKLFINFKLTNSKKLDEVL